MLEDRELVQMAKQRATEIIETATREAADIRRGGDEYAAGVLIRLEGECIKALTSIKRGIDMLDEHHRPARATPDETAAVPVVADPVQEPTGAAPRQ
jgi:hypothetical protein